MNYKIEDEQPQFDAEKKGANENVRRRLVSKEKAWLVFVRILSVHRIKLYLLKLLLQKIKGWDGKISGDIFQQHGEKEKFFLRFLYCLHSLVVD